MRMLLLLAVASAAAAAPTLKPKKPDDAKAIVGSWREESCSNNGQPAKPSGSAYVFRFAENGTGGYSTFHGNSETPLGYTLDPSKKPRRMTWTGSSSYTCIYEIDGDKMTLAFVAHGAEVPESIRPQEKLTVYYLTREKR